MDRNSCPLKRGISSLYESYEHFNQGDSIDSGSPAQVEGRRHTKRQYSPPKGLLPQCPVSLVEETNRQLMQQQDADPLRRHTEVGGRGEVVAQLQDPEDPTIQQQGFNPVAVAVQMEQLAAGKARDRLIIPKLGKVKKRVVSSIARLYNLARRRVPAAHTGGQSPSSINKTYAYFVTEDTAPLADDRRLLLEEILADCNRTKSASKKSKRKKKAAEMGLGRGERRKAGKAEARARKKQLKEEKEEERMKESRKQKKRKRDALALASPAEGVGNAAAGARGMAAALPPIPTWDKNQEARDMLVAGMQQPLQEDNKGSQMLVGMSWQHGQGIGTRQQGMLEPVMVTPRKQALGLGAV